VKCSGIERALKQDEKPEAKKLSHKAVDYESPSEHDGQRCGGCRHYIETKPPRCEGVQCPIRVGDWCHNFDKE
jgi:hypothetical protein